MRFLAIWVITVVVGALVLQSPLAHAKSRAAKVDFVLAGQVVQLADGDSISIVSSGREVKIRMSDFDAPEIDHPAHKPCQGCEILPFRPGQPGGMEAKEALGQLIMPGDPVQAECYEHDRYGRAVCHLFKDGMNINLSMIRAGWGQVFGNPNFVRDPSSRTAEREARTHRRGIWAMDDYTRPSKWRIQCWQKGRC